MATVVQQIAGGTGAPFRSQATEIALAGGVEEEYLFEGVAAQFRLAAARPEYQPDGRWRAEFMDKGPFRSRLVVARPRRQEAFNGTVIVYWNNVSMGVDLSIEAQLASQLIEDGFAVVGVTTQRAGVEGHPPDSSAARAPDRRPAGLKGHDPDRYGSLRHPGDGFSYDIYTQAAQLVGPWRLTAVDPMGGLKVGHLVAMGASQSASRLATYINAVQPRSAAFDAFLLNVYAGCPCALNPSTAPASLPEAAVNTFHLLPTSTYLLREDVGQPVIVLNSECELEVFDRRYQPDTYHLRFWEVPGSAHFGYMSEAAMSQMFKSAMRDACRVSFAPANRAAVHGLHHWLEGGGTPPHQPRLQKGGDTSRLPRDEHGNAIGGIRWPDLEAPLATHVGVGPSGGLERMMGRTIPFPVDKIRALYGTRERWMARYREAMDNLVETRVVLPDDGARLLDAASTRDIGI
jgi:Alpha/beta hydrolase domain